MYSKLFESIIQTIIAQSTDDVDVLSLTREPICFAGDPFHACESILFEQVLWNATVRETVTIDD
jgi:hypothetical protein